MDTDTDQCFGCGRTRKEIAIWSAISEAERQSIMKDLPARLKELEAKLKAKIDQTPIRSSS